MFTIIGLLIVITMTVVGLWAIIAEVLLHRQQKQRRPYDWEKDGGLSRQPHHWRIVDDG